jgi:surfeit locus 1 family protein
MLQRWRDAGLVMPILMTLAMLPVLIGLGTWQWNRKVWKEDLIAKIEARTKAEPVSYTAALSQYVQNGEADYMRVRIAGTFDHAQERHVYAPTTSAQGWHVYTLFKPEGGQPPLFVNRGWVPDPLKDTAKRAEGQIAGSVTITGLVRAPQVLGVFTPANDVTSNRYYARDLDALRRGADGPPRPDQLETMRLAPYAPFSIDAETEPANPGGWPKGGTTEIRLPNSHLQYVVTWYGLALTLLGVFLVFARQRLAALAGTSVQP